MEKPIKDNYLVIGTSSVTEEKTIVLKHDNTFAIFNKYGDIIPNLKSAQGVFHDGTRYLSDFRLTIEGNKPLFLSSNLRDRSEMFVVDLTNPDILDDDHELRFEKGSLHIMRKKVLWSSCFYEQIQFSNFGREKIEFTLELDFDADFADIFEVRGIDRMKSGIRLPFRADSESIRISYKGVDDVVRNTCIRMEPEPSQIDENCAYYTLKLAPGEKQTLSITMSFSQSEKEAPEIFNFRKAVKKHKRRFDYIDETSCEIETSNEQFNHWLNRSRTDLITMISNTPYGPYPYAGIPWFDTPFGRDGIITALECLWISPEVAKGVLQYLAATQATEEDSFRDAEPGKILHESREGEMAQLNEVPFRQYYGTIDATPLFIILAGEYFKRTDDIETIKGIWRNIEMALGWIERYGDTNNDLFVEYSRKEESGLFNQGWKDSQDSISYEDGKIAELPIALCEVQAYVFDAWMNAALMSKALGYDERSNELRSRAETFREKFSEHFWWDEKSVFYIALANGEPCRVISSNAGHCLFSGIATQEQAKKLSRSLLSDNMFTGWGIRTLGLSEARYNPMSYHNGSVWPHDSAMIAYGFAKYGLKEEVLKIGTALFDASLFMEGQRLPELFCGFKRRQGEAPTNYPVACSPQAWSVAAVFIIIQSFLGMEINEHENVIRFFRPTLPEYINKLTLRNLPFKGMKLGIEFIRTGGDSVSITMKNKNVRMEILY
jgi:glycogen debranching enzyme